MAIFTGAGVALVTPFREDGSVNYDKLDELIDYHCENGTDSIIICGTTGESSTLSEEEHMECIKFAVERTKKRIPVIAGTGSNATYTTIDMSKEAVEYGADGLLLVTPYYNKATQEGWRRIIRQLQRRLRRRSSCTAFQAVPDLILHRRPWPLWLGKWIISLRSRRLPVTSARWQRS